MKAPPELVRRIEAELDAGVGSVREIYDRHNLVRFASLVTVAHWAARRRRDRTERRGADTGGDGPSPPASCCSSPSGGPLLSRCVEFLDAAITDGRVKVYEVAQAMRALLAIEEAGLAANADRRAEELHELKLAELRKRQAAELEGLQRTAGLTDEQVQEIRLKVLGL